MQSGSRLVENVEGAPGRLLGQLGRQFHTLRFAAGKRRAGLAELEITQPDIEKCIESVGDRRDCAKESRRFVHREI